MQIQEDAIYKNLKSYLAHKNMSQSELAELLNMKQPTLSQKLNGKRRMDIDTAYKILDMIHAPYELFHFYFPPNGR